MPIRVLHVIGSLRLGGAQVVVKHIVENGTDGFESAVYPLRPRGQVVEIAGDVIRRDWLDYSPRKFFEIIKLCRNGQVDVLALHLHKPIVLGLLALRFLNVKIVVHEHGPIVRSGVQYAFYRFMLKRLWSRASAFVTVSSVMRDVLADDVGIAKELIHVVSNAVDMSAFDPKKADRAGVRAGWGVTEGEIVLGYIGRLNKVKGVDIFVNAMGKLPEKYVAVVGGTGDCEEKLKKLALKLGIEKRVIFLGLCKDPFSAMSGFDIGVIPSRQEAFGIVGLEMMQMEVPVVTSGVGGLGEYFTHEKNALVISPNDADQLCKAIECLAEDSSLREKLIECGRATVKRYGVGDFVNSIEAVYKGVLGR
jgi:glycosyltransferase involved in cell wall biosynthesis